MWNNNTPPLSCHRQITLSKNWRNLPMGDPKAQYKCTYQIWRKSTEIYSSYCPESKIQIDCGQITLSKMDKICPLAIPKQITISMHKPSLVKIHRYLLKLSSRNENMDVSRADNCQKLMKFAHQQFQTRYPQYQCTLQVCENPLTFTRVIARKWKYGRTDIQKMDRHTDSQHDTIISRHYHVAGYKNSVIFLAASPASYTHIFSLGLTNMI